MSLIAFLITVIIAYIAAQYMRTYGAEIYVVDLITILNALRSRLAGRGGRVVGGPPVSGTPIEGLSSVVRSP